MKLPLSMIHDFVRTDLTAAQLGELLTMAGFEVEGIDAIDDDWVFDIKVMSNRGDGLSALGLAREIIAKSSSAQATDLFESARSRYADCDERFPLPCEDVQTPGVTIETPACSRYACRLFTGVENGSSPSWMQARLQRAGMRPISLLVDLANYVMLEMGQPLHSFDYDKLAGGAIVVRQAHPGERMTTLDGVERQLDPAMMLICDAEKPVAVAGVMGGLDSEVSASTRRVLLESAHFECTSIRSTRKRLALSTEASYRFERNVDQQGVIAAIRRFTHLFVESGAKGEAVAEIIDCFPNPTPTKSIPLRLERSELLLGMEVPPIDARRYLEALGCSVNSHDGGQMEVTAPSWRPDLVREEDLIEELGRLHGYDRIPESLPHGSTTLGGSQGFELWKDKARELAVRMGFNQVISHSLRDEHPLDDPLAARVGPRGVNDPAMRWLRNSLFPSLADAAVRNGGVDIHLFEVGQVFSMGADGLPIERTMLGFLSEGVGEIPQWGTVLGEGARFLELKGRLMSILESLAGVVRFSAPRVPDQRLHPTRQAQVLMGSNIIGILGQIHPDVAERCGLPSSTILAAVDLANAYPGREAPTNVRPVSRNPAIRRDVAFLVDRTASFSSLADSIEKAGGDLLERYWLFDVYQGVGIPTDKQSMAIALQLRKHGANLTDEEANRVRDEVAKGLELAGATLR